MKLPPLKLMYSTREGFVDFEIPVKISTAYKFFYTTEDLPDALKKLEACPYGTRQYFDSFHELQQSVEKLIEEIELQMVEEIKAKVILYSIHHHSTHGQEISYRYEVVQKVEVKRHNRKSQQQTDVKYYIERGAKGHSMGSMLDEFSTSCKFENGFEEMAWSAAREAWFKEMERLIQGVGEKLTQGFGSRSIVLARRIDMGTKLLLESGE